jgi:hypothetical protein
VHSPEQDNDGGFDAATAEEKRNVDMNLAQISSQRPFVGGIYRDDSGSSFVVLNVIGNKALLEYANGSITTIDVSKWSQLKPKSAAY